MIDTGTSTGYRSPLRLARRLMVALAVDVVAMVGVLAWLLVEYRYDGGYLIGRDTGVSTEWLPAGLVAAVAIGVTAWIWIRWLSVSIDNLAMLGRLGESPRWWATWGWVVPPFAAAVPAIVMAEVWRATAPVPHRSRVPARLGAWWLAYLVGNPVTIAVAVIAGAMGVAVAASLAWMAAASIGMWLVERITVRQMTLAEVNHIADVGDWRKTPSAHRIVPAVALTVIMGTFVSYHGYAMAGSLIGSVNGWRVVDLAEGQCFDGASADNIRGVYVVPCDGPHQGETVGAFQVQGDATMVRPDEQVLAEFARGLCAVAAEAYTGRPFAEVAERLYVAWPSKIDWQTSTERGVTCELLAEGGESTTSERAADGGRVAERDLQPGRCYSSDPGFVTYREAPCDTADFRVTDKLLIDRTVSASYPRDLDEQSERCPAGSRALLPDSTEWHQGLRTVVCVEEH